MKRILDFFRGGLRARSAMTNGSWFRAGYVTALDDIERSGVRPVTDKTKREAADRALGVWVETGSLDTTAKTEKGA